MWPKNASVLQMKLKGEEWAYTQFIKVDDQMMFIEFRDKPLIPMLRILH